MTHRESFTCESNCILNEIAYIYMKFVYKSSTAVLRSQTHRDHQKSKSLRRVRACACASVIFVAKNWKLRLPVSLCVTFIFIFLKTGAPCEWVCIFVGVRACAWACALCRSYRDWALYESKHTHTCTHRHSWCRGSVCACVCVFACVRAWLPHL